MNPQWLTTFVAVPLGDPDIHNGRSAGRVAYLAQGRQPALPGRLDRVVAADRPSRSAIVGRGDWYDYVALAALMITPLTVLLRVLESIKRMPVY